MSSAFKSFEHSAWENAADQYDAAFSRLTRQVIPELLSVLEIKTGTTLLDVACGPGYLAAAAQQRGAQVVGVDFSAAMVVRAQRLHPVVEFKEGDVENLKDFPDHHFEAVAMNFGILHLDQPEKALKAIHRVLKPGGRVAFTVWCPPEKAVGFSIILEAIQKYGDSQVVLPPAPPFFHFNDPKNCAEAFACCGFSAGATKIVEQTWELASPAEMFEAFLNGTARTGGLLRLQTPEQRAAIREHVYEAAQKYSSNGKIKLPMPAQLAWAVKT